MDIFESQNLEYIIKYSENAKQFIINNIYQQNNVVKGKYSTLY